MNLRLGWLVLAAVATAPHPAVAQSDAFFALAEQFRSQTMSQGMSREFDGWGWTWTTANDGRSVGTEDRYFSGSLFIVVILDGCLYCTIGVDFVRPDGSVTSMDDAVRTEATNGMLVGAITNNQSDQVYGRIQAFNLGPSEVPTYLGIFRR